MNKDIETIRSALKAHAEDYAFSETHEIALEALDRLEAQIAPKRSYAKEIASHFAAIQAVREK